MEDAIRTSIAQRKAATALDLTIHGNRIRARLVKGGAGESAKVIGFVHNPDSDSEAIIDATQALLECLGKSARKRTRAGSARERWLVVASADGPTHIEAYRHACSQMGFAVPFKTILMVSAGGRVATLVGRERVSPDD